MKRKNVCGIANSVLANVGVLVTSFPRHIFLFLILERHYNTLCHQCLKKQELALGGRLVLLSI